MTDLQTILKPILEEIDRMTQEELSEICILGKVKNDFKDFLDNNLDSQLSQDLKDYIKNYDDRLLGMLVPVLEFKFKSSNKNLLYYVAGFNSLKIFNALVIEGEYGSKHGMTSLHVAALHHRSSMVQNILSNISQSRKEKYILMKDKYGRNALYISVIANDFESVEVMFAHLSESAKAKIINDTGFRNGTDSHKSLMYFINKNKNWKLMKLLKNHGGDTSLISADKADRVGLCVGGITFLAGIALNILYVYSYFSALPIITTGYVLTNIVLAACSMSLMEVANKSFICLVASAVASVITCAIAYKVSEHSLNSKLSEAKVGLCVGGITFLAGIELNILYVYSCFSALPITTTMLEAFFMSLVEVGSKSFICFGASAVASVITCAIAYAIIYKASEHSLNSKLSKVDISEIEKHNSQNVTEDKNQHNDDRLPSYKEAMRSEIVHSNEFSANTIKNPPFSQGVNTYDL